MFFPFFLLIAFAFLLTTTRRRFYFLLLPVVGIFFLLFYGEGKMRGRNKSWRFDGTATKNNERKYKLPNGMISSSLLAVKGPFKVL